METNRTLSRMIRMALAILLLSTFRVAGKGLQEARAQQKTTTEQTQKARAQKKALAGQTQQEAKAQDKTAAGQLTKAQAQEVPAKYIPADLVYPLLDTENSRWFYFASASRPFGMVNLSPDTKIDGAWDSGYRFEADTVKGFSHVHGWQISALSVMPVTITDANKKSVFTDFYSKFSHKQEEIAPGYHRLELERYGIGVELSSTKRVGFHKYTYPSPDPATSSKTLPSTTTKASLSTSSKTSSSPSSSPTTTTSTGTSHYSSDAGLPAILFNLNTLLGPSDNGGGTMKQTGAQTLAGELVMTPTIRRPKPFKVFFQIELNAKIDSLSRDKKTGNYLVFTDKNDRQVLMKAAISYTSTENALANMEAELPHWDFEKVVADSKQEWNAMLGRIKIEGGTLEERRRFYTDLWHALQGRRIISDVNGAYPDNTGETFRVGQLPLDSDGKPEFRQYNSDSFWGSEWTIQTLWGLVYPDVMKDFARSLLQYQKDGGMVPRGPSGGNYTYVMTGAGSTPFVVSAIQKGIVTDNLEQIYQALKKNHMPGGIMEKAGYEHNTSIGGGLNHYMENGYVPYPNPEGDDFGAHQDGGASMTMEYAYQDWALAQLAKKLGLQEDYKYFKKRSENYKNIWDETSGWMRPRDAEGNWLKEYDPYRFKHGFIEANGAQNTWYVPHDIAGLAKLMGGKGKAVEKLNAQFKAAEKLGFTSGDSHAEELHPEYRRIPINYGNQPSIQTAYIFNQLGRPDLTQYWSRMVVDTVYQGLSPYIGYNGDEDQGLMGSLAVLMKIGLFQLNGGTDENPRYEIGSPIFDKITIDLQNGEKMIINAPGASSGKYYIESVEVNGGETDKRYVNHSEIMKGIILDYTMGAKSKEQ